MQILPLFIRTALIYMVVFSVMRLMGRREIGKLSVLDLVISIMIAEIAVFAIEDAGKPLINGLVPIFSLVLIQAVTSHVSLKNRTFRKMHNDAEFAILETPGKLTVADKKMIRPQASHAYVFDTIRYEGLPLPLIMDGKVQDENLEKLGKTRFWLKNQIQQKGAKDFKEVFFCSIDHNGKLFLDRNLK